MIALLSLIKLFIDLGNIALDLLKAALRLYNQYMNDLNTNRQESLLA
jgi:hypothetical protein